MPPKKNVGVVIDGVDTSGMTREKVEVFALQIKEQNDREREERNYFQVERDKIRTFWEITRHELEETRAKVRNKDRQITEERDKNTDELKACTQMIKHLQYEHQKHLTDTKAEEMTCLRQAKDNYNKQERELLQDKNTLKKQILNQEMLNQEQFKTIKLQHAEELHDAEDHFHKRIFETELKFEKKFNMLKKELEINHRMEMTEVEERKGTEVSELIKYHEQIFSEMKTFYNDITLNNLVLVNKLKEQMEMMRNQNERMANKVADLVSENNKLKEPLKQALNEVQEYKRQLTNYSKDKLSLANKTTMLDKTNKEFLSLRWEYETLELRFENLQAEKENLQAKLFKAILQVEQKGNLKAELLHRQINELHRQAEGNDAIIGELTAKCGESQKGRNEKLKDILDKKNKLIQDLQYELGRVYKAHDDMLDTYEEKLRHFGIPKSELGFKPLRLIPKGQEASARGPAGLVTRN